MGKRPRKPAGSSSNADVGGETGTAVAPSWPAFRPSLPIVQLELEHLDTCPDKVILLRNFWPRSLCRDYVAFLKTLPLATTPAVAKRDMAVRVNDRFQIDDPAFANRLWTETGLREALGKEELWQLWGGPVVGLNSNIRVYRYSKGQFFAAHYDDTNLTTVPTDQSRALPCRTTWTLLLYLTSAAEGCVGGETVFYPHDRKIAKEEIAVGLETGMVLLHKHGDDCMLHEGREVQAGEKWVLRTDLCIQR